MLRRVFAVALALISMPLAAQQSASQVPDLSYTTAVPGNWSYRATSGGSESTFYSGGAAQVTLHCTRQSRMISVAKAASGAAPLLTIGTSSASRSLPAAYTPANARLTATVSAFDPLLDAMAFSRGRIAFAVAGAPALVAPNWAEVGRVIEDCRS